MSHSGGGVCVILLRGRVAGVECMVGCILVMGVKIWGGSSVSVVRGVS